MRTRANQSSGDSNGDKLFFVVNRPNDPPTSPSPRRYRAVLHFSAVTLHLTKPGGSQRATMVENAESFGGLTIGIRAATKTATKDCQRTGTPGAFFGLKPATVQTLLKQGRIPRPP